MHKILILLTIFILNIYCFHTINAQPYHINELKPWQIKGYAKSAVKQGDLYTAIYFHEYLVNKYPKNKKYLWQLANLQHTSRNYTKAFNYYSDLSKKDGAKMELATYYMAQNAMSMAKYPEAYELFRGIKRTKQKAWLPNNFKERVETYMDGCEFAMSMKGEETEREIKLLNSSINRPHIEFNPFYISDSVFIYSSSGIDSLIYYEDDDVKPKRKFYKATKQDTNWVGGKKVSKPFFNNPLFDTGDGTFSLDGNRFYFTQCSENWKHKMVCHLYVTYKEKDSWSEPQPLNQQINLPNYSTTQPTVGTCYDPKLEVIYFVSDRPEGHGGSDIWFTIYDTETDVYQKPINAGIYLNTAEDETTPFYDTFNHRLFFSSNGRVGMGGLDVFYAQGDLVNWNDPVNMEPPINSECDDLYYSEFQSGNKGFFTSNRSGSFALIHPTCCDDIYHWEKPVIEKSWIKGEITGYQYTIDNLFSEVSQNRKNKIIQYKLDSAQINLYLKKDTNNLVFITQQRTNSDGLFNFSVPKGNDYVAVIDDKRVLNKKIEFTTKNAKSNDNESIDIKQIKLKTLNNIPTTIRNIHFEYNNDKLTPESKVAIQQSLLKLMMEYTDVMVEISSHTANKGNDKYNMKLSQRRANNIVSFLISEGIENDRLKAVGYGNTKPITQNKKADGTDNPEGRAMNTRIDFMLIEESEMRK